MPTSPAGILAGGIERAIPAKSRTSRTDGHGDPAAGPDSLLVDLTEVAFRGIPGCDRWQTTALFLDTGAGFRGEEITREFVDYGPEFEVTFCLDLPTPVRQLRWDPLEMRFCNLRLHQVLWRDDKGLTHLLDLDRVTSNGERRDEAAFQFETLDPMIFLPIAGSVANLTIRGECLVESEADSSIGLERIVRSHKHQVAERDRELQLTRERTAVLEQSAEAHRHQVAERDRELQLTREQLAAQERSAEAHRHQVQVMTEHLQDRERRLQDCAEKLSDVEIILRQLEEAHQSILNSKRWRLSNQVRSTIYFIPSRLTTLSCNLGRRLHRIGSRLKPPNDGELREVDDERTGRSAA